jgi:response regulator RpfG family c-di-GMP phosphodiesterase
MRLYVQEEQIMNQINENVSAGAVMIVDDNNANRDLLSAFLLAKHFIVFSFTTADEFLVRIGLDCLDCPDVIFMDVSIEFLKPALDIPYYHHEKWDGSGYPRGLKGAEIPFAARIFAVADVWDALTSDRPYRAAWTKNQTLEFIEQESGKHFDPDITQVFLASVKALIP